MGGCSTPPSATNTPAPSPWPRPSSVGYCLRTAAQGPCAYANICEHCPNFRSGASFLPVLQLQRADAEALAADAQARGWGDEAARHRRLIERIDLLITQADAS